MTGEWTPDYLTFPGCPRPVAAGGARHPPANLGDVTRSSASAPASITSSGIWGTPRDGTAIADAVQRGFYFRSLEVWLDDFDADQLLVLQYERCVADSGRSAGGDLPSTWDCPSITSRSRNNRPGTRPAGAGCSRTRSASI